MAHPTTAQKRDAFFSLHERGCFLIPNPWDVGSARMLEHLGFSAVATTSTGYAWSLGRPDYQINLEDALGHLRALSSALSVPVNADFEWGFAKSNEELRDHVSQAIETGIAGLSIEDRDHTNPSDLSSVDTAAKRIGAARSAIDASQERVMLVGRTEELLIRSSCIKVAIDRLKAFADAGADCLYAPGVSSPADIEEMVRAIEPKPLNVVAYNPALKVTDYERLGVRRVSIGGAFALTAWATAFDVARKLKDNDLSGLTAAMPGKILNEMFADHSERE